ncbi:hypothetical protein Lesp02_61210 [Lentzea sp. NBRC 105346]|uniref:LppA family lipoprotein n=1 Tax=Lentzea sp. NBRC 105346 TaxID=3032205 RepID=UPI0025571772|nr:LppA family lipoprotein [Lentzea sp. NBRC 105346]GLZ33933.1 hypothetical protein Lesp02_61210 [Lentzea sp. NBRC 105346]
MDEVFAKVLQRPDIEQAVASYTEMTTKIRERLTAEFGRAWEQMSEGSGAGCGDEYNVLDDAENRHLPSWTSKGNLPDDQWPRAEAIVGEVAEGYGFHKSPVIIVKRQGDHEVVYDKPDGAQITFGTAVNTVLGVMTGCHLTPEAHRRGTPKAAHR